MYLETFYMISTGRRYNLQFIFLTNGVMLSPKVINKINRIHKNIKQMNISIDSAKEETYNVIRKGGNFTRHIKKKKILKPVKFCYSFVIQNSNYTEIEPFVDWIRSYPKASIRFTRILNWSNMAIDFNEENIFNSKHQNNKKLLSILDKIKDIPNIDFHNVF